MPTSRGSSTARCAAKVRRRHRAPRRDAAELRVRGGRGDGREGARAEYWTGNSRHGRLRPAGHLAAVLYQWRGPRGPRERRGPVLSELCERHRRHVLAVISQYVRVALQPAGAALRVVVRGGVGGEGLARTNSLCVERPAGVRGAAAGERAPLRRRRFNKAERRARDRAAGRLFSKLRGPARAGPRPAWISQALPSAPSTRRCRWSRVFSMAWS